MKKIFPLVAVLAMSFFIGACHERKTQDAALDDLPYNRSSAKSYENKIYYSVFVPFMYENNFYSYYTLGKKIDGPDSKGFYTAEFVDGPKKGETIRTNNILLKVHKADAVDLKKGMVVLVNYWNPREHNNSTPVDMWRKGVVYNLEKLSQGLVMLEFPYDSNDFMATKETYDLKNIWLVLEPKQKDPRVFL
ncbi:MAG: hypothetical protein LBG46_01175 [Elusimicrobiota bacterium]|jgi:hypothetical protein|nr:hypothetical protein [Elusimicrobiota bacterium]